MALCPALDANYFMFYQEGSSSSSFWVSNTKWQAKCVFEFSVVDWQTSLVLPPLPKLRCDLSPSLLSSMYFGKVDLSPKQPDVEMHVKDGVCISNNSTTLSLKHLGAEVSLLPGTVSPHALRLLSRMHCGTCSVCAPWEKLFAVPCSCFSTEDFAWLPFP